MNKQESILISRTDSIGDVILTLPLIGWLKQHYPNKKIIFLGRNYTIPILSCCSEIDEIWSWDDPYLTEKCLSEKPKEILHVFPRKEIAQWAKKMQIQTRIGTLSRWYHWFYVNHLIKLSRKNSDLHEAQLNLRMVLAQNELPKLSELPHLFHFSSPLTEYQKQKLQEKYLKPNQFNLILHPKSQGSAREWALSSFLALARTLNTGFHILISGTAAEAEKMAKELHDLPPYVHLIAGELSLDEYIALIGMSDGLIAASTGPLHIAAASGIHALGIFPPIRPMHPGRWAPIGVKAEFLVKNRSCSDCKKTPQSCHCIQEISVAEVTQKVLTWK